jgi:hypothetical protein
VGAALEQVLGALDLDAAAEQRPEQPELALAQALAGGGGAYDRTCAGSGAGALARCGQA